MSSWGEVIVTFVAGGSTGGILGYFIRYLLDIRFERRKRLLTQKREVYNKVADAMRVFLATNEGEDSDAHREEQERQKTEVLSGYQQFWLWAADEVVSAFSRYLATNQRFGDDPDVTMEDQKEDFAALMLEMRRDAGFPETDLEKEDYEFVGF